MASKRERLPDLARPTIPASSFPARATLPLHGKKNENRE
jgi:hypothetical protein